MELLPTVQLRRALLVPLVLLLCSACTAKDVSQSAFSAAEPVFSGPHAVELKEAYQSSKSDYFRLIIQDEIITDAEYAESQNRAKRCLEALGFTDIRYFLEGGSEAGDPPGVTEEDANQMRLQCEEQEGLMDTEMWYFVLRVNPDNLDWSATIRDCMVARKLIEPGTTVSEMEQWLRNGGKGASSPEASQCLTDPLGKLGRR